MHTVTTLTIAQAVAYENLSLTIVVYPPSITNKRHVNNNVFRTIKGFITRKKDRNDVSVNPSQPVKKKHKIRPIIFFSFKCNKNKIAG